MARQYFGNTASLRRLMALVYDSGLLMSWKIIITLSDCCTLGALCQITYKMRIYCVTANGRVSSVHHLTEFISNILNLSVCVLFLFRWVLWGSQRMSKATAKSLRFGTTAERKFTSSRYVDATFPFCFMFRFMQLSLSSETVMEPSSLDLFGAVLHFYLFISDFTKNIYFWSLVTFLLFISFSVMRSLQNSVLLNCIRTFF